MFESISYALPLPTSLTRPVSSNVVSTRGPPGAAHASTIRLNHTYAAHDALWTMDSSPEGFEWIDSNDADRNTLAYLRKVVDSPPAAVVINFAGVPHEDYRLGLPAAGRWRELVNTDAYDYGGSGVGNLGAVTAVEEPWHGQPASVRLRVPPLGAIWLAPE